MIGGTGEARELAGMLDAGPDADVISAVVRPPADGGRIRVVPDGVEGLVRVLRGEGVDRVVDASHPFDTDSTAWTTEACRVAGVRVLRLDRPVWEPGVGDRWFPVADPAAAAASLTEVAGAAGTAFLTQGRMGLTPFAADRDREFLVRAGGTPSGPLPVRTTLILDHGPYTVYGETALMNRYGVAVLVAKNSGGTTTSAKLIAARHLEIPVVMIQRPPVTGDATEVETVPTVQAAFTRLGCVRR